MKIILFLALSCLLHVTHSQTETATLETHDGNLCLQQLSAHDVSAQGCDDACDQQWLYDSIARTFKSGENGECLGLFVDSTIGTWECGKPPRGGIETWMYDSLKEYVRAEPSMNFLCWDTDPFLSVSWPCTIQFYFVNDIAVCRRQSSIYGSYDGRTLVNTFAVVAALSACIVYVVLACTRKSAYTYVKVAMADTEEEEERIL